jgi:molecular chaperone DnaJ
MASAQSHYHILEVPPSATPAEIKQAYRRLAKLLHPDRARTSNHEAIARLNGAYEVLSDPLSRRSYDQQLGAGPTYSTHSARQSRTEAAQDYYRKQRQAAPVSPDAQLKTWINRVYTPANRVLNQIIRPLRSQINQLAADPFDDDLMANFQTYLDECRSALDKAQKAFKAVPNPPNMAAVAAHLYYCINQVGDGLNELEYFTSSYDESYLHDGLEMFRIAEGLRKDANAAVRAIPK